MKSNLSRDDSRYVAKKSLGQHFLKNRHVVEQIISAGEICKEDNILEIGPGFGALTKDLLSSPASKIYLCEKDDNLCKMIKDKYSSGRTKVICEDALVLIPSLQIEHPFKVISNLPYNISSPVIISLLTACPTLPDKMVLMLQKEVAQRLIAKPGDSNRGWLTALLDILSDQKILTYVSKFDFSPVPQVESAVLVIDGINMPDRLDVKILIRILKAAFAGKRKKIKNSLFTYFKIPVEQSQEIAEICAIDLNSRAEDLDKQQWLALAENFSRTDFN